MAARSAIGVMSPAARRSHARGSVDAGAAPRHRSPAIFDSAAHTIAVVLMLLRLRMVSPQPPSGF